MVKNAIKIYARLKQEYQAKTVPYLVYKSGEDEIVAFRFYRLGSVKSKWHIPRLDKFLDTRSSECYLKNYRFDQVFDQNSTQAELFDGIAKPVVHSVIDGFNGTIFAYGQTGSGKTYAITGSSTEYNERGLIPRSIEEIFSCISKAPEKYSTYISYLEIYNEVGYDLLNTKSQLLHLDELRVILLDDGKGKSHLRNLTVQRVSSEQEAMRLLSLGDTNRTIAETPMNVCSSRSHCIFTISINTRTSGTGKLRRSKLNLVDLAGSERICKSDISGTTLNEAKYINLSLHYLEQVILALSQKKSHIPFRNSTLTYILKDSLSGNCKTVLLSTLNINKNNIEETLATCKFAQRVAEVSMEATVNEEADPLQEIECLKTEIEELRKELLHQSIFKVSGCLTAEEKEQWKNVIKNYLDDTKDHIPFTTFDMRLITYSFKLLKDAVKSREDQKAKLKTTEIGNKDVIQQYESVIKQKEEEISTLKSLLCGHVSKHPNCSSSFVLSESDDSALTSYIEQEKENIPENSDSFTLSPGQKVAFEVFMKDSKNTTELDYYKKAIQDMFTIAKKITLVVEKCQQDISAARAKPRTAETTDGIESELQKLQIRYKGSLQKLHHLKNKTTKLKNGLERSKMKILIRFKRWYDSISTGENIIKESKNNPMRNKTRIPQKIYTEGVKHCSYKMNEDNSRPVNSADYEFEKSWQQRNHSPCSTISSISRNEEQGNITDDEHKCPSQIPKLSSRKDISITDQSPKAFSVEVETVFEGSVRNREKSLFETKRTENNSHEVTTTNEKKHHNENLPSSNSVGNELKAPSNSEVRNSRTKIPDDSYYNSKINAYVNVNNESLLYPFSSPDKLKTDDDNSSNISKDYSLGEECLKNYIGKVRSPYKFNIRSSNTSNDSSRPRTASNNDKPKRSMFWNTVPGPQRPEHLNDSLSYNIRASSAQSARKKYHNIDTVYKMIMGYEAAEPIDSMRPYSANCPLMHDKFNLKHRIGGKQLHNSRSPTVGSLNMDFLHSSPDRNRHPQLSHQPQLPHVSRHTNYNNEKYSSPNSTHLHSYHTNHNTEECKFLKRPGPRRVEPIDVEQETLESVFNNRKPYYATTYKESDNAYSTRRRISPDRERLIKETDYNNYPTVLHQTDPDCDISGSRNSNRVRTLHRVLRPDSAGKEAYYSKLFFPDDSSRFRRFINTIPLTGDSDVDEEIVKFYRSKLP